MNREKILSFLSAVFDHLIFHQDLIQDLVKIIDRSGFEKSFFNILLARLKYLCEHGVSAVEHREAFESLSHQSNGLYSMRLKGSNFNIRILYAFLSDGSPVLLVAFAERRGKRVSSYDAHIPIAKERLKFILEEYGHEQKERYF